MSLHVDHRRASAALLAVVLASTTLVSVQGPAVARAAADLTPTSGQQLANALDACDGTASDPFVVVLDRNLEHEDELIIRCTAELHLEGHLLRVQGAAIAVGDQLTVGDSTPKGRGHLESDASYRDGYTGIGVAGARLIIERGHVTARGGPGAAGIGGGYFGDGGNVTVRGGTVTAVGGAGAAGIGGGFGADGGTLFMRGGTVTARSSGGSHGYTDSVAPGAGVGGGDGGAGGSVALRGESRLVVLPPRDAAPDAGTLIGGSPGQEFGGLIVGGRSTLHLSGGLLRIPDNGVQQDDDQEYEVVITRHGRVLGSRTTRGAHAQVSGAGEFAIYRHGAIWLPAEAVRTQVWFQHYRVSYDTAGGSPATIAPVTVFAARLADAGPGRHLPPPPAKPGMVFTGWTAVKARDGERTRVTERTILQKFGNDAVGEAVPVELRARYSPANGRP